MTTGPTPAPGSAWSWRAPRTRPSRDSSRRKMRIRRVSGPSFSHYLISEPAPFFRSNDMAPSLRNEAGIFNAARKIDAAEARQSYLEQACGGDRALQRRIEGLLRAHAADVRFLETPAEG